MGVKRYFYRPKPREHFRAKGAKTGRNFNLLGTWKEFLGSVFSYGSTNATIPDEAHVPTAAMERSSWSPSSSSKKLLHFKRLRKLKSMSP
jgi:hypothetical protein